MIKDDVAAAIAAEAGCSKRVAEDALNAFMITVERALRAGEEVSLSGFGTFSIQHRAPRTGRTTVNGVSVPVPIKAQDVPVFKPTKSFRDIFR